MLRKSTFYIIFWLVFTAICMLAYVADSQYEMRLWIIATYVLGQMMMLLASKISSGTRLPHVQIKTGVEFNLINLDVHKVEKGFEPMFVYLLTDADKNTYFYCDSIDYENGKYIKTKQNKFVKIGSEK